MITKEEFIKKCDAVIPQEEKELYNKKTRNMWIAIVVSLIIDCLVVAVVYKFWHSIVILVGVVGLIVLIVLIVTLKYKWNDFKRKYSKAVFDCLLKGYSYNFNQDQYISSDIFNASCFRANYDSYKGEDLLSVQIPNDDGTPSGVSLNVCDLNVTKQETRTVTVRNADGSTSTRTEEYTVTVFSGVFGYIHFPFEFKCGLSLNIKKYDKKIKLEDIKFNKKFKTYTNNQLEALLILTPVFMGKMLKFAHGLKLKFYISTKGAIYFSMNKNIFKLKTFNRKPCGKVFERFYDDISNLLVLIDEIKNNNKVFKM